jgi:sugar (pentulose or hexulose) kinase
MELFLGIDLGTSYFKAGLFDTNGVLCGLGRKFVEKVTGDSVKCELQVGYFWSLIHQCLSEAYQQAQAKPEDIRAVSYSSQASSFLLLDKSDMSLTPLILWPDSRVEKMDLAVLDILQRSDFRKTTGLGISLSSQFCIAKIRWFQKNQPSLWGQVKRIMTISDYLTFGLTGQTAGDLGTASLLGLLDIQKCLWWDNALQILELDQSQLSKPFRLGTMVGTITKEGARRIGLPSGIPFIAGSLDHHVAALGAGLGQLADMSESTGTVLACVNCRDEYFPKKDICIAPGLSDNHYFQMAFDENGANSLEWYLKQYAPGHSIPDLLDMAADIKIGSEGLIASPCTGSYKNPDGFKNITQLHQHGHFVRAILESTALSLAGIAEKLVGKNLPERIVSTGGGSRSTLWRQIKADLLGKEFAVTECSEPACLGAALFAAIAVGRFNNIREAASEWIKNKEIVMPDSDNYKLYSEWSQYAKKVLRI